MRTDFSTYLQAHNTARLMLKRYREETTLMVEEYCGLHWGPEGNHARQRVPVNLISFYRQVVAPKLISQNPRAMISTDLRQAKALIAALEDWINKELDRLNVGATLELSVVDALFSMGILKVALATPVDASNAGWNLMAGQPFLKRVLLDDFVCDMHARSVDEFSFAGHRYRATLDSVKGFKFFSKQRKDLAPATDQQFNREGDERINVLGRGFYGDAEYEQFVDLWEIYFPRTRQIVTFADDGTGAPSLDDDGEPLRVQEWLGPDCGPFHYLGMAIVPGNCIPKAPMQDLLDLHLCVNRLYRKLMNQGERAKDLTGVKSGATEDGERVLKANDGDILRLDDPNNLAQFVTGNVNQQVFIFVEKLRELFSDLGGNLNLLGGTGPQAKTATQDEMLMQSASAGIQAMQQRTMDHTVSVLKALSWYWLHNPAHTMNVPFDVPGLPGAQVQRNITPQMRRGVRWEDLKVSVDPYSLLRQTPQQRAQQLMSIVQNFTPLLPLLQQQGIMLDMNALLTKLSAYMDMPDLPEIMTISEPPADAEASGGDASGSSMAPQTTRTYNRVSQSANTPGNGQQELQNQLQAAQFSTQKNGTVNR